MLLINLTINRKILNQFWCFQRSDHPNRLYILVVKDQIN